MSLHECHHSLERLELCSLSRVHRNSPVSRPKAAAGSIVAPGRTYHLPCVSRWTRILSVTVLLRDHAVLPVDGVLHAQLSREGAAGFHRRSLQHVRTNHRPHYFVLPALGRRHRVHSSATMHGQAAFGVATDASCCATGATRAAGAKVTPAAV